MKKVRPGKQVFATCLFAVGRDDVGFGGKTSGEARDRFDEKRLSENHTAHLRAFVRL